MLRSQNVKQSPTSPCAFNHLQIKRATVCIPKVTECQTKPNKSTCLQPSSNQESYCIAKVTDCQKSLTSPRGFIHLQIKRATVCIPKVTECQSPTSPCAFNHLQIKKATVCIPKVTECQTKPSKSTWLQSSSNQKAYCVSCRITKSLAD